MMYDNPPSELAQFQEEEYGRIAQQERTALLDAGETLPVVTSHGWRFKKTGRGRHDWGATLESYNDRDKVLDGLQLGQRVNATLVTRRGRYRRKLVRVTWLAYGHGRDEAPTRADGEFIDS